MSGLVKDTTKEIPVQVQRHHPGTEHDLKPRPQYYSPNYRPAGKLEGKVALITGGDSGIGRSVACLFAVEGAQVAFTYKGSLEEKDKEETCRAIEELTQGKTKAFAISAELGYEEECKKVIDGVVSQFGRLDILVNNASEQFYKESIDEISSDQLERTFRSNIFSMFFVTKHALRHMQQGASIINTTSVVAYKGEAGLLDYTSTKGAILAFTRGLALQVAGKGIRVNGVAPGPIWTPLIAASFPQEMVEGGKWSESVPMKRAGQPIEAATSYVFLASEDASYFTGQILHPNGGTIVNA